MLLDIILIICIIYLCYWAFLSVNPIAVGDVRPTRDDIDKFYQMSKGYVEWDGDKFVPKPLALSKINLTQLRDRHLLKDRKVIIRYSIAVLSIPINFVQYRGLTVTDEWRNLKDKLKGILLLLLRVT